MRHRVIEAGLNDILGLHNKPKAEVQSVHKLTGPKKKKKRTMHQPYNPQSYFLQTQTISVHTILKQS